METNSNLTAMAPIASIIITTYKRPHLLKRAVQSARRQNFENFEVIVVDDDPGSGGSFKDIDVYIQNKVNQGLAASRNIGIAAAKGKYVVCLDDDNELGQEFLGITVRFLEENPYMHAVGTGRVIQYSGFSQKVIPQISKFTSIDWGWLIRREVFDYIKYDENCKANEDTDFGIRFFKSHNAAVIPYYLTMAYDSENPEDSLSFPTQRELDGITYFLNKNLHEYTSYPNELRYLYRLAGRKFYRGGYKKKGLSYFWKSFRAQPSFKSFLHFFIVLFGWKFYDAFMSFEERRQSV